MFTGGLRATYGAPGSGPGQLSSPEKVVIDQKTLVRDLGKNLNAAQL